MRDFLKRYGFGVALIGLLAVASILIYAKIHQKKLPSNLIEGVGRILGDEININTKYPARIKKILVEEGSEVKKNQIVAVLYSKEFEAQRAEIEASIRAKEKELKAKEIELEILKESLPENVKKAFENVKAKEAVLEELNQKIDTLKKVVLQDEKDYERFKNLYSQNLIQKKSMENAKLKLHTDRNSLKALKEKKKELISILNVSKSTLKQAKTEIKKINSLMFLIESIKDFINSLKAKGDGIEAMIEELTLRSPVDGYVTQKIAQEGEVAGAGMPIISVVDPKEMYLKIFVDTLNNAKVKIGDRAVIFLDGMPSSPIDAKVVRISKKAEFTPKEVAVRSDRIQRVFALHLKPLKPNKFLKLGIPAVGIISVDGKGLPKSLKDIPEI